MNKTKDELARDLESVAREIGVPVETILANVIRAIRDQIARHGDVNFPFELKTRADQMKNEAIRMHSRVIAQFAKEIGELVK
jgi:hypothetical protein